MNKLLLIALAACTLGEAREAGVQHNMSNATNSSRFDVVTAIRGALNEELTSSTHPKLIGAAALLFGSCLWLHGAKSLDIFVIVALAVVVGILAKQSVLQYWHDKDNHLAYIQTEHGRHMAANFVGVEAGLVTAAAVIKGHKGVMVGVGAAAAFWFASAVSTLMVKHVSPKFDMAEVQVVWQTIVVFPVAYAVYLGKHVRFLVYVAPFAGSVFISSALMYFATDALAENCKSNPHCSPPHPRVGQWVDFFKMAFRDLVSTNVGEDFGMFHAAGKDIHIASGNSTAAGGVGGGVIFLDHIILLVAWIFFALVGCKVQGKIVQSTTKGREHKDLSEALLQRL